MKIYICIIIFCFGLLGAQAQNVSSNNSPWSLSTTIANMRYPFLLIREDATPEPLFSSVFRPSFSVAVERDWGKSEKNRWFQTLELQSFKHRYIDIGASVITEIGYEHRFWQRLILGFRLGAGRQLAWKDDQYQVYDSGEWKTIKNHGSALGRWVAQGRVNLGWQLSPNVDVLLGLRAQAITPFYKPLDVGLNIATAAEVGARWRF